MATREKEKKIIIEELSDIIAGKLLDMKPGTTYSIAGLVKDIYLPEGYDFIHLGPKIGYVWTKDGGKTFTITDWEQEDVLFQVKKKIRRKRRLDFLEDDKITIYGVSEGLYTYKSTMGGHITIPIIRVDKIDQ